MKRPEPIREIVIRDYAESTLLYIWTASQDAYNWVKIEAPAFGTYREPDEIDDHHTLFVSPLYDPGEVIKYLDQGYNSQQ